jgi:hypothetical protein
MDHITPAALASWQNFYVIVGSSSGALMGLQFVVMTLVTQSRSARNPRDVHAFGTPTVVHFVTALLISAIMAAPWQAVANLAICVAACGLAGVAYSFRVFSHARQAAYKPDLEDRFWYLAFPLAAHLALVGSAVLMWSSVGWALPIVAADALVFLMVGVHNSWDTVTFIAARHTNPPEPANHRAEPE